VTGEVWFGSAARVGEVIDYSTADFDFADWARLVLQTDDLGRLHERMLGGNTQLEAARRMAVGALSDAFGGIEETFHRFVATVAVGALGPLVAYQVPPVFRVQFAGASSISRMHKDRDYSPSGPDSPVLRRNRNVWVPLTPVRGGSALWVESAEDRGDFAPVSLEYGQVLVFDAMSLSHGSRVNDTGMTRVSFEFRCLPMASHAWPTWCGVYRRTALHLRGQRPVSGPELRLEPDGSVRLDGVPLRSARYWPQGAELVWDAEDGCSGRVTLRELAEPGHPVRYVFSGSLKRSGVDFGYIGERDPGPAQ